MKTQNEILRPIKNGKGEIKGYIKMYWCNSAKKYVSVPA